MGFLCVAGILTRQVGFESKGLELDLQKTAADYSFDPSEQAGQKPRDMGTDGLWRIIRRFVFCFEGACFWLFLLRGILCLDPAKIIMNPSTHASADDF